MATLWAWLRTNAPAIGLVFAVIAGGFALFTFVFPPSTGDDVDGRAQQATGQDIIQVDSGGGDVTVIKGEKVDVKAIVETLVAAAERREAALREQHQQQLAEAGQREQELREQFEKVVQALVDQGEKPDAPAGIDNALGLLAEGKTEAAEAIFQDVLERREAEGATALKDAAAAARHIGALAFLHDTRKSMAAYEKAVELDPDNADGWTQLGLLLRRTGDLESAERAHGRVLSLGNRVDDKALIAIATGNLGTLYQIRGDLGRAEELYEEALALNEALGRKEGVANQYGNLGVLYQTRGDLDRAEEMHLKSLEVEEALGRKEGMADQYGNLGVLYQTRGDLDRAEEMYRKGLALDEALGRKEGLAAKYGNLGILYKTRGDLDRAEEMYKKALALNEAVGRKEGMADNYGNLGILYEIRGDLDRAEELWVKSLGLFKEVGAARQIEQVEGWLTDLRAQTK